MLPAKTLCRHRSRGRPYTRKPSDGRRSPLAILRYSINPNINQEKFNQLLKADKKANKRLD